MTARIQRKRTKGWRAPEGAVYVGRGTCWGNPAAIGLWASAGLTWRQGNRCATSKFIDSRRDATVFYRLGMRYGGLVVEDINAVRRPHPMPSIEQIRNALAGRDLMCWCPLPADGEPDYCHASVLLELANAPKDPS